MTDSSPSPFSTPKRKRPHVTSENGPPPVNTQFRFDASVAGSMPFSDESSPRSKVAHKFGGLVLADRSVHSGSRSGGGVAAAAAQAPVLRARTGVAGSDGNNGTTDRMQIDEDESKMRKRTRISPVPDANTGSEPPTPQVEDEAHATPNAQESQPDGATELTAIQPRVAPAVEDAPSQPDTVPRVAIDRTLLISSPKPSPGKLSRPAPAVDLPDEMPKTKADRKRDDSPSVAGNNTNIDPVRAALTWHENEITVYDPEDEDDDGVGINGIGFKPTPAIAYARTMKRRQQLAEYRKREEKEARARRSHRRRGSPEKPVTPTLKHKNRSDRKVRFTEAESTAMIETI
ncbi:hypothetical protein M406DRAFT_108652 [Cryphonectria parasitica EP155]|uniref:Uncharacterized protein n=1 Tax=Cryphonectria parasitica (strain ATCC 38755 / EP155) TaxID=660469 RepID=A0A9P5CLY9_CRYP1|nr:uncharacterized protein M406DRAFT_108652 [Cryphonectria parasitica EP155]KAF3763578.1 hypothetical protein M406DRAFT_108652 [Cryphonectria parasitica EP155]